MSQLSGLTPNIKIGGALPFTPGGNPMLGVAQLGAGLGMPQGAVQGLNTLAQQYGQSYSSALQQNQAMYNNILQGYQGLMGTQQGAQQGINQGYSNLKSEVLGDISNIGASEKQAITDAYAQQSGAAQQSLINRGLGNATISDSVQRGLGFDQQKAQIALQNQMAQLTAGYASNLGMAGLNYQNQANMQNTALGTQQLNWMNTVNSAYPDSGQYNALFGQAGQQHQMNQDRLLQQQLMRSRNPFGGGGGGGGGGQITYGPHANLNDMWGMGPQDYSGGGGGGLQPYMSGGRNTLMGQMPQMPGMQTSSYGGDVGGGSVGGWTGNDPNPLMNQLNQPQDMYAMDSAAPTQDPWAGSDPSAGIGVDQAYAMDPYPIDNSMQGQGFDTSGYGATGSGDFSGGGGFADYGGDYSGYA